MKYRKSCFREKKIVFNRSLRFKAVKKNCVYLYINTPVPYRNKSKKLIFELCTANSNVKLNLLDAIEKKLIGTSKNNQLKA